MNSAVDFFILLGSKLEGFLDYHLAPSQKILTEYFAHNWPQIHDYFANVLKTTPSIHAANLPLMNPFHVLVIIALYLAAVFGGKFVMQNFGIEKMQLKTLSNVHNAFCVWLSGYMCFNILYQAYFVRGYSLFNNQYDDVPESFPLAKHLWLFYFSKVFEFMDTMIMVGKKNFRQISFLHVYHHSSIFAIWWVTVYMCPHGESYFSAMLNSWIHVIMYSYYLFSSLGVAKQFTRAVKPYITMGQMVQFTMNMVQSLYDLICALSLPSEQRHTKTPVGLILMLQVYMWTMLGLFGHFYVTNYKKPQPSVSKKSVEADMKKEE